MNSKLCVDSGNSNVNSEPTFSSLISSTSAIPFEVGHGYISITIQPSQSPPPPLTLPFVDDEDSPIGVET